MALRIGLQNRVHDFFLRASPSLEYPEPSSPLRFPWQCENMEDSLYLPYAFLLLGSVFISFILLNPSSYDRSNLARPPQESKRREVLATAMYDGNVESLSSNMYLPLVKFRPFESRITYLFPPLSQSISVPPLPCVAEQASAASQSHELRTLLVFH